MSGLTETPLSDDARIVIVGASVAGLRAAEQIRNDGFSGRLTLIGDEAVEPYDRPPLSKQVAMGKVPADATRLPRLTDLGQLGAVDWMLGARATSLDRRSRLVHLADGREVDYDRLLITTGSRNRRWFVESEAELTGVASVRDRDDAAVLASLLAARPNRVLVIGGGFTGSEIASACRHLDLPVTLVERGASPLIGPLGPLVGSIAADMQRDNGVDLRCGVTVQSLDSDGGGNVCGVTLSDGSRVEVDVVVVALGAIRNTEWLTGSGLAVGPMGVTTDTGCRAFDAGGLVVDDVFAAGDVARSPHPVYGYQFLSLEHWENAVNQSRVAGHNMVCRPSERRPHLSIPVFWSIQFGHNIKCVGVPNFADQIQLTQGSAKRREFVAAYGHEGRLVAAVTFDQARPLDYYRDQIEAAAAFPLPLQAQDGPASSEPQDIEFPHPSTLDHWPTVVISGHHPDELSATLMPASRAT